MEIQSISCSYTCKISQYEKLIRDQLCIINEKEFETDLTP